MAVRPQAQMGEVEQGRRAGDLPKRLGVLCGRGLQVGASTGMAWICSGRNGARASRLSRKCVRFLSGCPAGATRSST